MAKKFHIKPNGDPGLCRAFTKCPYGGPDDSAFHYPSEAMARRAFEREQGMLAKGFNPKSAYPSLANFSVNDLVEYVGSTLYVQEVSQYDGTIYADYYTLRGDNEGPFYYDSYGQMRTVSEPETSDEASTFNMFLLRDAQSEEVQAIAKREATAERIVRRVIGDHRVFGFHRRGFGIPIDTATGEPIKLEAYRDNLAMGDWVDSDASAEASLTAMDAFLQEEPLDKYSQEFVLERTLEEGWSQGESLNVALNVLRKWHGGGVIPSNELYFYQSTLIQMHTAILRNQLSRADSLSLRKSKEAMEELQGWVDDLKPGTDRYKSYHDQLTEAQEKFTRADDVRVRLIQKITRYEALARETRAGSPWEVAATAAQAKKA